jgi:hypothetical protein
MTYNQTGLVRYDAMVNAIAAAYEVDEVKDIRDRAKGGHAIGRAWIHAKRNGCEHSADQGLTEAVRARWMMPATVFLLSPNSRPTRR